MRVWAEVYSPAGVLQGDGPITQISRVQVIRALDGAGSVALGLPPGDKQVNDLIAAERRTKVYGQHPFSRAGERINFATSSGYFTTLGNVSGTHYWLGQSFVLEGARQLVEIGVYHGAHVGAVSGGVTIEMRPYIGGVAGAVLDSWEYTPADNSLNAVPLADSVDFEPGPYCLAWRPTTPQSLNAYWMMGYANNDVYLDGSRLVSNNSGVSFSALTGDFYIYIVTRRTLSPIRLLGIGIQQKQRLSIATTPPTLVVDGPDQLGELKDVNCWLNRTYNGVPAANVINDLMGLAEGWTVDTSAVPTVDVFLRMDGASVLKALQELCKRYDLHFRWTGDKAVEFGPLGDAAPVRLLQAPAQITDELMENDDIALVDRLTLNYDSETLYNVLLAVGANSGGTPIGIEKGERGGLSLADTIYGPENAYTGIPLEGPDMGGETITITASGDTRVFGFGGDRRTQVAQTFTLNTPGYLDNVTFRHAANTGTPVGAASVQIKRFADGVIQEANVTTNNYMPTASATNTVPFTYYAPLLPAGQYALVWDTQEQEQTNAYGLQASASSTYSGGSCWVRVGDGEWTEYASSDIQCTVTVTPLTPHLKLAVNINSGWVLGTPYSHVVLYIQKVGNPTKNYRARATQGTNPGGTELAVSQDIPGSILSDSAYTPIVFIFDDLISYSDKVWIELEGDGTPDDDNYILVAIDGGGFGPLELQTGDLGYLVDAEFSTGLDTYKDLKRRTIATYGSDQCTGGTASASSDNGASYTAAKAFDNDNATAWITASGSVTGWLQYQFSANKTIRRYTLYCRTSDGGTRMPKTWTLQGSATGVYGGEQVTLDSRANETGWSSGETRTYDVAAHSYSFAYYRLVITANNGHATYIAIGEMEMMEVATYDDGYSEIAQIFQVTDTEPVKSISIPLKRTGSAAGTGTVRIETVSGGNPSGTLVNANMTATFSEADVDTVNEWVIITFSGTWTPDLSTDYALRLSTSRSASEENYISWYEDSGAGYANGDMKAFNGSSWSSLAVDGGFQLLSDETTIYSAEQADACWLAFCFDSGHSDPYDLNVMMGPDGAPLYYLKDDVSIASYGRKERTFSVNIRPASDSAGDIAIASSAIYDAAAAYLSRYAVRQVAYSLTLRKAYQTLLPGQVIDLTYKGYVWDDDGNKVSWLNVSNEGFWITRVTESGTGDLQTSLEISNVPRGQEDLATAIINTMDRVSDLLLSR